MFTIQESVFTIARIRRECTRAMEQTGGYLHLDHGHCGIEGPTDPVFVENQFFSAKVQIPRKCENCRHLKVRWRQGFVCGKEPEKWGDFTRSLDWGYWEPDVVYVRLPPAKLTTRDLVRCAGHDDLISFIKEYRRVNPGSSILEAKEDFKWMRRAQGKE